MTERRQERSFNDQLTTEVDGHLSTSYLKKDFERLRFGLFFITPDFKDEKYLRAEIDHALEEKTQPTVHAWSVDRNVDCI